MAKGYAEAQQTVREGSKPPMRFEAQTRGRRCQGGVLTLQLMDAGIAVLRNEANHRRAQRIRRDRWATSAMSERNRRVAEGAVL